MVSTKPKTKRKKRRRNKRKKRVNKSPKKVGGSACTAFLWSPTAEVPTTKIG